MDAWECIPHWANILLRNDAFIVAFRKAWDPCSCHTVQQETEFFLEFWGCQKVCAVKELHTAMPPSVEGRTACRLSSYKPLSQMALFN